MKRINCLLIFSFILLSLSIQAQDEKETKFNIIAFGGIGYGIMENDIEPNYNLNSNNGEILLNYRLNQKFGVATGVGFNELSGNGFNSEGNFYHERSLLKIPLMATLNYTFSGKFRMIGNLGFYSQNVTKDEYRFLNNTKKDVFKGWSFGALFGAGFVYELNNNFSLGFKYNGQSDFTQLETNGAQTINEKQRINNLNSFGLVFLFDL
jgi:opacity protein-like surface antigen